MNLSFSHRAFMLDSCRHFMPPADIRRLLSAAAVCGINRMHWHLTDDQGWRVQIRKYPRLTEVGARRGETHFGGVSETENNCGYYTQDEIRELVSFAAGKGIDIIPEIELPGHACALLAAYPEFACRTPRPEQPYYVQVSGGIFPDLVCAGRDETVRFLEDILEEVISLFPFPMVHIGGDEALKVHWRRCPDCQRRMQDHGLQTEDELQRWLVLQIGEFLHSRGRETIVWNDVLAGGFLPDYFIVQQWMGHEDRAAAWMARGGRIICSDTKCWYFDYPYGTIDLHHIWQYPRIPDYAKGHADQLLGLEAPLWTERITNPDRAAFMLFPRLAGLGLKASGRDADTWEEQCHRIRELQNQIEATGVKGAPENYWYMSEEAAREDRQADHDRIYAPDALPFVQAEEKIVLLDETERFMQELGIPRNLMLAAGDMIFYRQASAGPVSAGADILIRQLTEAVKSRKYGAWHRLPENVWMDTMKCYPRFISEHRRSYGVDGFDRGEWTTRQVSARLFRLGELEYELLEETAGSSEQCISLHIPSDAKLTPDLLNDSVKKAREFLSEYFPDWADLPMCCESWLLSPRLQEWLPESSGIIRFQNAFDIEETDSADETALEWVFYIAEGQRASMNPASFPESTSLQRRMKADYLSGGKPGSARGRLARDFA